MLRPSRQLLIITLAATLLPALTSSTQAGPLHPPVLPGEKPGWPLEGGHVDQRTVHEHSFEHVYRLGQRLFRAEFNRLDGAGANLSADAGTSVRFTRAPNIHAPGSGAPLVRRPGGPEAQNCGGCHLNRRTTGSGVVYAVSRDQQRTGDITQFFTRDTTNLNGTGALQLLAQQTTKELHRQREKAIAAARRLGRPVTAALKNRNRVSFGRITAHPDGSVDTSQVRGVLPDLQVRPFHVKGLVPFLRLQSAVANHVSVGMQGPEVTADAEHVDEDGDGVVNEFTAGDMTAIVAYVAGLPRPVNKLELHEHVGGRHHLTSREIATIKRGERVFADVGCAGCHTPRQVLENPVFHEPSDDVLYRFDLASLPFFGGRDPLAYGLDPRKPVSFDLTDNPIATCSTTQPPRRCWRQFERNSQGHAIVRAYGDQRVHDMGPQLAAEQDELGNGASVWRTRELWGVADTGPWLHDGRATTLPEAIWWHGGEAQAVRDAYFALPAHEQTAVIEFLNSLVLYIPE